MSVVRPVLADMSAGISELKKNPMAVIKEAHGEPVAILNRNEPVFYAIPAEVYEKMLNYIEELELAQIVKERQKQKEVKVNIDDL